VQELSFPPEPNANGGVVDLPERRDSKGMFTMANVDVTVEALNDVCILTLEDGVELHPRLAVSSFQIYGGRNPDWYDGDICVSRDATKREEIQEPIDKQHYDAAFVGIERDSDLHDDLEGVDTDAITSEAKSLYHRGCIDEALRLLRKSASFGRCMLAEVAPIHVTMQFDLAELLREKHYLAEALAMYSSSLAIQRLRFGETLGCVEPLSRIAEILEQQGRSVDARAAVQAASEIHQRILGSVM
jgi:hypothetical protein